MPKQRKSYNQFNAEWITDTRFCLTLKNGEIFSWLKAGKTSREANCVLCSSSINVASMGVSALVTHSKTKGHELCARMKTTSLPMDFKKPERKESLQKEKNKEPQPTSTCKQKQKECQQNLSSNGTEQNQSESQPNDIEPQLKETESQPNKSESQPNDTESQPNSFVVSGATPKGKIPVAYTHTDAAHRAEILWVARRIMTGNSKRSLTGSGDLFRKMFPDSEIARAFRMEKDKAQYIAAYGLGQHYKDEVCRLTKEASDIVILFDEALNSVVQKSQMDVYIQYFDGKKNQVDAHYLSSTFLTKARASDIQRALTQIVDDTMKQKLIQIQMDGPNVNFACLRTLEQSLREKQLLDLGSCGLHTINGALQFGFDSKDSPDWDISNFLKSIYYLLHDTPARRGEYVAVVGNEKFPMKYCPTRWTENVPVADRALELLDALRKYANAVASKGQVEIEGSLTKLITPKSKSFGILQQSLKDPRLEARLWFFRSLSAEVLDFLKKFQCEQPVAFFLHSELVLVMKNLLRRIVKRDVVDSWSSKDGLKILDKDKNMLPLREVDIGLAANRALRKQKMLDQEAVDKFRKDAKSIILMVLKKIWDRSPLSKPLTKSISGFNPECYLASQSNSEIRVKNVIEALVDGGHIDMIEAENALRQWKLFICDTTVIAEANAFKPFCHRIDDFYSRLMSESDAFPDIFNVVKKVLILSHGNALVERGVSTNKHLLQDNLLEETVILLRHAYDGIKRAGGPNQMDISKELLKSCRFARQRCIQARELRKEENATMKKRQEERKKELMEIRELQSVKRKLQEEVDAVDDRLNELKKKKF